MTVEVEQQGDPDEPVLTVSILTPGTYTQEELSSIRGQLVLLLGTSVDLARFYELADTDQRVGPLKDRLLGLRPPRFPTLFEAVANAIANQQLSLEVGIGLLNGLTERFGARPHDAHGLAAFPEPEAILGARLHDLRSLGFSMRKSEYLMGSAHVIATGALDAARLATADRAEATEILLGLRGIGRWSAEYVLLRGMGRIDVFPADDVGARNKLQRFMDLRSAPSRDQIVAMMRPWNPCAGMIYFHLLLDSLAERGELDV